MTKKDLLEIISDFDEDIEIKANGKEIKEMKISRKNGKVFVELITDGMDQD